MTAHFGGRRRIGVIPPHGLSSGGAVRRAQRYPRRRGRNREPLRSNGIRVGRKLRSGVDAQRAWFYQPKGIPLHLRVGWGEVDRPHTAAEFTLRTPR